MTRAGARPILIAALAVLAPLAGAAPEPPAEAPPRKTGLVEKAGARLAQLDVTVTGPRDAASRLTADQFEVWVAERRIETFDLDAVCFPESESPLPAARAARPASYLFYFDQRHLTPVGRRRALAAVREMVPRLIVDGSRGMVVSSSRRLRTFAELTPRPDEILTALLEMENDPDQNDPSTVQEDLRVAELERTLIEQREEIKVGSDVIKAMTAGSDGPATPQIPAQSDGRPRQRRAFESSPGRDGKNSPSTRSDLFNAVNDNVWGEIASLANQFQRDENVDTALDFRRLAAALGGLAETDPPKVVLYFADTARRNAGEHFAEMFSDRGTLSDSGPGELRLARTRPGLDVGQETGADSAFSAVLEEAASGGVRFYAIQAEGLAPSSTRVRDAQNTLSTLAVETGGRPFLNGPPADRMAGEILSDLSCLYLVSFDPRGLPEDRPLPVRVALNEPGLSAQVRGQIVLRSEKARRASELLAAFSRRGEDDTGPISAAVIPTGYERGRFAALVQVAVPSPSVPGGTWEIGASLVSGKSVREVAKRAVGTNVSGIPVILEEEERIPPGPYEIVAVARDTSTNAVVSRRIAGALPDLGAGAAIGPIAVLEPVAGAFARGKETRTSGSLARSESEPVRADLPAAIVGLVCRGADGPTTLLAERRLVGEAVTTLAPIELDLREGRCAQIRDVIPANTLGAGRFVYEILASAEGVEVARGERSFLVVKAPGVAVAPVP